MFRIPWLGAGCLLSAISCLAAPSSGLHIPGQIPLAIEEKLHPSSEPLETRLASPCAGYTFPEVVCLHRYGSVLQLPFERPVRNVLAGADTYSSTNAPSEPSFNSVRDAQFLVMDPVAAVPVLGPSPSLEYMFVNALENRSHEAPVYSPETNELIFSRLQESFLPQLVVNLNDDPPTLTERIANPPIYAATGARYYQGLIYISTIGGNESLAEYTFRPGIYTLNATSGESRVVLNNYYGYYFNGVDDFDIDDDGQIWFTDNHYGRPCHVNTYAPQMYPATYRFNLSSGLVAVVEDSLLQPNGATFSPDYHTLYLTDTGAGDAVIDPTIYPVPAIRYSSTKPRTIYAYDVDSSRKALTNKRPLHLAMDYVPDGIKVSRDGYIVSATGHGVSILTPAGEPVVTVQTNFTVINIAWAGRELEELWAVGHGGMARIRLGLRG